MTGGAPVRRSAGAPVGSTGRRSGLTAPAVPARPSTPLRGSSVLRDRLAGSLRPSDDGSTVTLAGWVARRRDHGGVIFIDLRDASGVVQVVFHSGEALRQAHALRNEFCVRVVGEVAVAAGGQREPGAADRAGRGRGRPTLEVLSESAPLPFQIDDPQRPPARRPGCKYRYLDLRRSGPANALRLRSEVNRAARQVLDAHDFVEIETPDADPLDPRGRPRLPGARPAAARLLVRAAAVAAAVQAAADGRRHGALLPDRPLLPGRGLPRRPAAGVHPARRRDVVRHQDDVIALGEQVVAALWRLIGHEIDTADPADHLRRRDGPLRLRQAGPALRSRDHRADRSSSRTRRSGCSRRPTSARSCSAAARPPRGAASTPGRSGPSSAARAAWRT